MMVDAINYPTVLVAASEMCYEENRSCQIRGLEHAIYAIKAHVRLRAPALVPANLPSHECYIDD